MTGIPAFFALASTAAPTAGSDGAMTRTLTPWLMKPSARVVNFWASPCAFWTSALKPCAVSAAVSIGLSNASHRAEVAVSGRITPTVPLAPPPDGAEDEEELVPPLGALLVPHAVSTRPVLTTAARRVRVLLRILCPSGTFAVLSARGRVHCLELSAGRCSGNPAHRRAYVVGDNICR